MKVAGVTIIRNAVRFDYPVLESIRSVLPLVDTMFVGVGDSEDGTRALIESLDSEKVVILDSKWDDSLREGGRVLAVETNKVIEQVNDEYDWIIYIQADEVIHEYGLQRIREGMEKYLTDKKVEGLLLQYRHFYGHYRYIGDSRRWYRREIRIVKNLKGLKSFRDAQGFRIDHRLIRVKLLDAWIHHYGWVKNPKTQFLKDQSFQKMWHSDEELQKKKLHANEYDYNNIDSLKMYSGTHPQVMQSRIEAADWEFIFDIRCRKLSLKNRILEYLEKLSGRRFFEYRNYRLI